MTSIIQMIKDREAELVPRKRKTITPRTGERLARVAFELEEIANRLADEGFGDQEIELRDAANQVHRIGHRILDKLSERN